MFRPLPARVDLPELERDILARWQERKVFERSIEATRTGPPWVFYEGPPTANGEPGTHHVEARVFKDVFPRFKTMKGYYVPRKAGWDCHGLPVEVAVEKELGLSGKPDIEAYGVEAFNARCRESVQRYVGAFEEMTHRMGYWVDMSEAYRTMDATYVESVWWSLQRVFERGLLVEDYRITPYCPRCGTGLSDHELGQEGGYENVLDPSVTVRLPLTSGRLAAGTADAPGGADLLVWTTTPWTLVSNTAVAVHPEVTYVRAEHSGRRRGVVVAEPLVDQVLGDGWRVVERFPGRELERATYEPPFRLVDIPGAHMVVPADYVTVDDGTGLVHLAPAFGADDLATCRAYDLPVRNPIRGNGRFEPDLPLVDDKFFKEADPLLVADLDERGLLFHHETYDHSYPHCWRCHTPLLYYALPSWYIRTTAIKDRLLEENAETNWYPDTIKWGRYGEWLRGNVDWALSRSRYWGTPLPIWRCPEGHLTCVGSLAELGELSGQDLSGLDPHRPYVDEVLLACPQRADGAAAACGARATRVPEVIDAWYDSGSMPFAQWGYPHHGGEIFQQSYPANFICEAIDQTRGWFYSLMTVGTLVFDQSSYQNVLCLGHILAEDGRKMSKHLGNVLEPMPLMERHGADAVRWFMATSGSPWTARRIGHAALEEIVRKVLLTYWNTASFFVLYANAAGADNADNSAASGERAARAARGWTPELAEEPPYAQRPLLDRWALAELHRTVTEVDDALENYDTARAGRRLSEFVDDLSNWYVRRSRRRFWQGPEGPGCASAFATLYTCLETLTRLLAPLVPFVSDAVWDVIRRADSPDSVHLARWPQHDPELLDATLSDHMALTRRLVELGRAARSSSAVRTRQPLGRALVDAPRWRELPGELRGQLAEELNVHRVDDIASASIELLDYEVKPNFRALGKRFGNRTPAVADAISAADPAKLAAALEAGAATVNVEGEDVPLEPAEVIVTQRPRSGWTVSSAGGETVALDLEITPELHRAGLAREFIRLVQDARKSEGLDVSDRIHIWWQADDGELAAALREHTDAIADEILARSQTEGLPDGELAEHASSDMRLRFWLRPLR